MNVHIMLSILCLLTGCGDELKRWSLGVSMEKLSTYVYIIYIRAICNKCICHEVFKAIDAVSFNVVSCGFSPPLSVL